MVRGLNDWAGMLSSLYQALIRIFGQSSAFRENRALGDFRGQWEIRREMLQVDV